MDSHSQLRTLQKKRTTNFREDETKLLIQLWGSPQIQNKLYLTHRKAPVMRLLAANMQHRGFYRTPDEIKTRIRNLKCLYHRIKRSMQTGAGIGTVDPDWPHFKAMDEILSKKHQQASNLYKENILEGPRCEDIKQEIIDDIDINDDMESFTTNSPNGSDAEFEDEAHHMPPLVPAPDEEKKRAPIKIAPSNMVTIPQPKITPGVVAPKLQIPLQPATRTNGTNNTNTAPLPFPLLILNGLPQASASQAIGSAGVKKEGWVPSNFSSDISDLLKNLIDIQKENLEIEKQRLEIERQTFEYHKTVGSQLLSLFPIVQKITSSELDSYTKPDSTPGKRKRPASSENSSLDILKDSKILRTVLEEGIKKYMMSEKEERHNSETDDSGVQNDENSDDGSGK